ncbi:hypothetical protein N431DRAFT_62264 [Stipitochalara longipes BDJ]|nr:hypothetical protein N431DRAFT_62264 [Stipitochalara longipes BDJ]
MKRKDLDASVALSNDWTSSTSDDAFWRGGTGWRVFATRPRRCPELKHRLSSTSLMPQPARQRRTKYNTRLWTPLRIVLLLLLCCCVVYLVTSCYCELDFVYVPTSPPGQCSLPGRGFQVQSPSFAAIYSLVYMIGILIAGRKATNDNLLEGQIPSWTSSQAPPWKNSMTNDDVDITQGFRVRWQHRLT